ncbi:jg15758 [Pararge aegeria aegeria]|uniref:Jg15758 protein n=1 Tax=Pararge aegeria aegeria TaxID=348720 RepID=A0A8S4RHU7_9NEOP|nr:jg15758 [Pararge aegeria aegeria]
MSFNDGCSKVHCQIRNTKSGSAVRQRMKRSVSGSVRSLARSGAADCDVWSRRWRAGGVRGGPRVRELRRQQHAAVAPRRHGPLPVQRVRPVPQDQRRQPAVGQAEQAAGEWPAPLVTLCLRQVRTPSCSRASTRTAPSSAG